MPVRLRETESTRGSVQVVGSRAMTVRAATLQDLDAIMALEIAVFAADRLSRRALRRFLSAAHKPVMIARRGDGIAGYAVVSLRKGGRTCRIYSLAVDPLYSRRGVGRELAHACERYARAQNCDALRLEARYDNAPALALYRSLGYQEFERFPRYYSDGAEALRFEKKLGTA